MWTPTSIGTYTGKIVDLLDFKENDVNINDIAHALSMLCRYGGHCRTFYSVAEHSVRMVDSSPTLCKLEVLFHDAAEAYVGDVVSPLKQELNGQYKTIEDNILKTIYKKYKIKSTRATYGVVRLLDKTFLRVEQRDLFKMIFDVEVDETIYSGSIEPWSQVKAKRKFLQMAKQLGVE